MASSYRRGRKVPERRCEEGVKVVTRFPQENLRKDHTIRFQRSVRRPDDSGRSTAEIEERETRASAAAQISSLPLHALVEIGVALRYTRLTTR